MLSNFKWRLLRINKLALGMSINVGNSKTIICIILIFVALYKKIYINNPIPQIFKYCYMYN